MKRLVLGGLSLLLLTAATAPSVSAQTTALNPITLNSNSANKLTPFNLVTLAHRGYFKEQGISSYTSFTSAYNLGQITARDLVQAAVNAKRLAPESLTDREYLRAVDAQMNGVLNSR